MSKVITFSTVFPKHHIQYGEKTFFVEHIVLSLLNEEYQPCIYNTKFCDDYQMDILWPKHHTIRSGNRFKVGDKFSARIWSGKPYRSKQIEICSDVVIKKIYSFSKDLISDDFYLNGKKLNHSQLYTVASNDGLLISEFVGWFNKHFNGQIICWSDAIDYDKMIENNL